MKPTFQIIQIIEPPTRLPWGILETIQTSDGPRTRICLRRYASLVAAQFAKAAKEND